MPMLNKIFVNASASLAVVSAFAMSRNIIMRLVEGRSNTSAGLLDMGRRDTSLGYMSGMLSLNLPKWYNTFQGVLALSFMAAVTIRATNFFCETNGLTAPDVLASANARSMTALYCLTPLMVIAYGPIQLCSDALDTVVARLIQPVLSNILRIDFGKQ